MSNKNEAVAESIIRCEGLTFALANLPVNHNSLGETRKLLKERIVKELDDVYSRGLAGAMTGDAL